LLAPYEKEDTIVVKFVPLLPTLSFDPPVLFDSLPFDQARLVKFVAILDILLVLVKSDSVTTKDGAILDVLVTLYTMVAFGCNDSNQEDPDAVG